MYWILVFEIRPEPDSTGCPAGSGTKYFDTCLRCIIQFNDEKVPTSDSDSKQTNNKHCCISQKYSFIIITQKLAEQCGKLGSRDCRGLLNWKWEMRIWDIRYLSTIWPEPSPEPESEKWPDIYPTGSGYPVHPYRQPWQWTYGGRAIRVSVLLSGVYAGCTASGVCVK